MMAVGTATTAVHRQVVLAFVLRGKVQGVKMRRYVEAAGRNFKIGGYVINTDSGDVFGEAWTTTTTTTTTTESEPETSSALSLFEIWIRGEQIPLIYTNIKPTPIGTAYPELARVDRFAISKTKKYDDVNDVNDDSILKKYENQFSEFTMVRDDDEAANLLKERSYIQRKLSDALDVHDQQPTGGEEEVSSSPAQEIESIEIGSWPNR